MAKEAQKQQEPLPREGKIGKKIGKLFDMPVEERTAVTAGVELAGFVIFGMSLFPALLVTDSASAPVLAVMGIGSMYLLIRGVQNATNKKWEQPKNPLTRTIRSILHP